jgi:exopolyphosphatase/pppGpp-phosphohydrolase
MEISRETIRQWLEKTMTMSTEALIAAFPAVMTGRADIFPSGLLILHTAMTYFNVDALMVSCGGIREGAVLLQYLSEV